MPFLRFIKVIAVIPLRKIQTKMTVFNISQTRRDRKKFGLKFKISTPKLTKNS